MNHNTKLVKQMINNLIQANCDKANACSESEFNERISLLDQNCGLLKALNFIDKVHAEPQPVEVVCSDWKDGEGLAKGFTNAIQSCFQGQVYKLDYDGDAFLYAVSQDELSDEQLKDVHPFRE